MNRQDLASHLKQSSENVVDLLKAAQLPLDLPDFTPEQVQVIEAIAQLVSSKQSKSYQEAGEVYRKPIREGQLNEVVGRHQIAPERIPEILAALKFKPETLTDAQLEQFADVCTKLQAGIDLAAAVPAKATRGKKAPAMPEFVPQSEDAEGGAIAIATPTSITAREMSQEELATLQDVADAAALAAASADISDKAAEIAVEVVDQVDGVLRQMIVEAILGKNSQVKPDPERAVARVHEIRAQRGQR